MNAKFDRDINLVVDMYGCPNRCKHCWLGHLPNTKPRENADRILVDYFAPHFKSVTFYSWLREPDFCQDYELRWQEDNRISVGAKPQRFELASFWRIVRDKHYVEFLKKVGVDTVQLTFFGLKQKTDSFVGRKGAFEELLQATELLIANEIAPRWQAFLYQTNKEDIVKLLQLSKTLELENKCSAFGKNFRFFIHEGTCDGENAKLYPVRINKKDIPPVLIPYFPDFDKIFSERELCKKFEACNSCFVPHNNDSITLNITNNFDVYYNFTHMTAEWRIGNLLTDRKEDLLEKIVTEEIAPLQIARKTTVAELIKKYGNYTSERAFSQDDYFQYLLNLCVEYQVDEALRSVR